ncbi:hypothetical protein EV426DRAFT_209374 [Tirmania nivea]|nr:hypothetical protein EV426DRAFT_209374 [Tirmania nivea]
MGASSAYIYWLPRLFDLLSGAAAVEKLKQSLQYNPSSNIAQHSHDSELAVLVIASFIIINLSTKATSAPFNRMSGSGARRRAPFALPFTPVPSPTPRAPPVPRHPQAFEPSPTRHPRGHPSGPPLQKPGFPRASQTITSPSSGEPGRASALSSPSSSPPSSHSHARSQPRRTSRLSRPHPMSPINASNPALAPLYNGIIFLCCCLPVRVEFQLRFNRE